MNNNLTKYEKGSVKEMLCIFLPLILSYLSQSLMTLCDRIFVSRLGFEHLQGLSNAGVMCFTVVFSLSGIAGTAAIFVGRFNGEGKLYKVCVPVWQMIYFALMCSVITLPIGIFGADYLLPKEVMLTGQGYFQWAMGGAFLPVLITALAAFFAGTGNAKKITISAFVANSINLVLNIILIFGIPGCFKELGLEWFQGYHDILTPMHARGAAIATTISQVLQIAILMIFMLRATNRNKYKTDFYLFDLSLFKKCLRLGSFNAFTRFCELLGWSVISVVLTKCSLEHLNVQALFISMLIAFSSIGMSIRESTTAIISNHIGAKDLLVVRDSLKAAFKVLIMIFIFIATPMVLFADVTLAFLTGGNSELSSDIIFYKVLLASIPVMVLSMFISCANAAFFGLFTAGGSVRYIALINTISTWCFAVIPIVFIISNFDMPLKYSIWMYQPYRIFILVALYVGYKKGKWLYNIER